MTDAVITTLLSGVVLGSLYAMMASGLSVVWTTLGVFNFSHGALMTLGAFVAWSISEHLELGVMAGLIVGTATAALTGVVIERVLVRPYYTHRNMMLITVMTTLAAMIIIEKGSQIIWGPRLKQLPRLADGELLVMGSAISVHEALIVLIAPLMLMVLWIFTSRTAMGRSLRAVGQNQTAAALIGIHVPRAFSLAFALSAGLAGFTGVLLGSIRFVTPTLGAEPLVKAMTVVILGGLGSLGATAGAAYVIGFLEAILILTVGLYWTPSLLFLTMIMVLVFRPNGLFGRQS